MAGRHGMQVHNLMKSLISEQLATRLAMRRPTYHRGIVECCMLEHRKACCCTFDSYSALKQIIRPQEWLCHSRLRMVQSLQITGMKQNVLFLQRASMRKLIKGKHEKRCSFLERKGDRRSRWIVDSTLFE